MDVEERAAAVGASVAVAALACVPDTVTVRAGQAVQWENEGAIPHALVCGAECARVHLPTAGAAGAHVFPSPGTCLVRDACLSFVRCCVLVLPPGAVAAAPTQRRATRPAAASSLRRAGGMARGVCSVRAGWGGTAALSLGDVPREKKTRPRTEQATEDKEEDEEEDKEDEEKEVEEENKEEEGDTGPGDALLEHGSDVRPDEEQGDSGGDEQQQEPEPEPEQEQEQEPEQPQRRRRRRRRRRKDEAAPSVGADGGGVEAREGAVGEEEEDMAWFDAQGAWTAMVQAWHSHSKP